MKKFLSICAITLAISGCAGQQDQQIAATGTGNVKKICQFEKKTGSNIGKRVCRTQEEMDAMREANKAYGEELKRDLNNRTQSIRN